MGAGARFLEKEYLFLMVQSFSAAVRGAGLGTNLHVGGVVFFFNQAAHKRPAVA